MIGRTFTIYEKDDAGVRRVLTMTVKRTLPKSAGSAATAVFAVNPDYRGGAQVVFSVADINLQDPQ
jgi:hypothetical protein